MDIKGCCGFNRGADKVTFIGIFTFPIPMMMLGGIGVLILSIIGIYSGKVRLVNNELVAILKVSNKVINEGLNSRVRCMAAAKLFKLSPKLSGITYKYFNSTILISLWIGMIWLLIKWHLI